MIAVDTNVLARFILQDDRGQAARAAELLADPVWVPITVWLELGWVLGKQLRLDRPIIADALETLLAMHSIHAADRSGLRWAIDRFRAGADWADVIHLIAAADAAHAFATFDERLGHQAGSATPMPVEALA